MPSEAGDHTIRDDQSGATKIVESETEKTGSHLDKQPSQTSSVGDESKEQGASSSCRQEEKPSTPSAKQPTHPPGTEPFEKWERDAMEELLQELRGHLGMKHLFGYVLIFYSNLRLIPLVLYPTRFLEGEDVANNFLFNADRCVILFRL